MASFVAGFVLCLASEPMDNIQVKLTTQSMNKEEQKYNGIAGTAMTIMKEEGPLGFFRGFFIAW